METKLCTVKALDLVPRSNATLCQYAGPLKQTSSSQEVVVDLLSFKISQQYTLRFPDVCRTLVFIYFFVCNSSG